MNPPTGRERRVVCGWVQALVLLGRRLGVAQPLEDMHSPCSSGAHGAVIRRHRPSDGANCPVIIQDAVMVPKNVVHFASDQARRKARRAESNLLAPGGLARRRWSQVRVQREAEAGGNAASWSFRKCQPQQRDTLRRSVHRASCWSTSTAARNIDAPRKLTALRSTASAGLGRPPRATPARVPCPPLHTYTAALRLYVCETIQQ